MSVSILGMDEKESPFDKGLTEAELIESAYQSVKGSRFTFSVVPIILVKRAHRECAKKLYHDDPSQTMDLVKEILPFLTLASAVIEEKSAALLKENLIQSDKQDAAIIQSEINHWSQGKKENWLLQLGLIDPDFKEKMEAVRKTRNRLVHDPDKYHYLEEIEYDSYTLPEIIEFALECAEKLDKRNLSFDEAG